MAKQVGPIKITGTFDNICFYHDKVYGYLVRMKGGPSRKQFKTSPRFERSRENSREFEACSRMASRVRRAIVQETNVRDKKLFHRLMKLMRQLLQHDTESRRGERLPLKGMLSAEGIKLLQEFELFDQFNLKNLLEKIGIIEIKKAEELVEIRSLIVSRTRALRKRIRSNRFLHSKAGEVAKLPPVNRIVPDVCGP